MGASHPLASSGAGITGAATRGRGLAFALTRGVDAALKWPEAHR